MRQYIFIKKKTKQKKNKKKPIKKKKNSKNSKNCRSIALEKIKFMHDCAPKHSDVSEGKINGSAPNVRLGAQ